MIHAAPRHAATMLDHGVTDVNQSKRAGNIARETIGSGRYDDEGNRAW